MHRTEQQDSSSPRRALKSQLLTTSRATANNNNCMGGRLSTCQSSHCTSFPFPLIAHNRLVCIDRSPRNWPRRREFRIFGRLVILWPSGDNTGRQNLSHMLHCSEGQAIYQVKNARFYGFRCCAISGTTGQKGRQTDCMRSVAVYWEGCVNGLRCQQRQKVFRP